MRDVSLFTVLAGNLCCIMFTSGTLVVSFPKILVCGLFIYLFKTLCAYM